MITLNGFKNTTPLEKRSRRFRAASVAIGTVAAIVFVLCAIAMQASAQDFQAAIRWQQEENAKIMEGSRRCQTQHPELWAECQTEQARRQTIVSQKYYAMIGGRYEAPSAGPGWSQTTCRWVGINWTCDMPGGQTTRCHWIGQNWTC